MNFLEQHLNQVLCMDALEFLSALPDSSADLIIVDPPYFKVKKSAWDRQWDTPAKFIEWIGTLCEQWRRVLKPNGSLYCFASPQMAARVEVKIGDYFNVLNNIIWYKPSGRADASSKQSQRTFFPSTERIVFAEQYGSDKSAKGEAGYERVCDELRGFIFEPLRAYIASEISRSGKSLAEIGDYCEVTSRMIGHYTSTVQWELPTRERYAKIREYLNNSGGGDYLRREYDYLRREYEDLRRPFSISADVQFTDVWNFFPVQSYPGKHECEKPLLLLKHMIEASSKPGAVVLDCFVGSGATLDAARQLARNYIGCDMSEHWANYARHRLTHPYTKTFLDGVA